VPANALRRGLDFLSDWAVLAFAAWTLLAYIGMATGAKVSLLIPIWLAITPFLALGLILLRRTAAAPAEDRPRAPSEHRISEHWRGKLPLVGVGAGIVAGALAAWLFKLPWAVVWLPMFVAAAAAVVGGKLGPRAQEPVPVEAGWVADVVAFATSVGLAVMSLFLYLSNPDDVFYVNRATATAQLNKIPVLDVIFTREEVARAGGAGLPVDSYSALQGALARFLGLQAPTVAYLVFPVVFTFLATWTLWRLVRAWAPRHAGLCFVLGAIFWLWSAQFGLTSGSYFLTRIWQGKVAFVAWLVPTIYVYLSRWLGARDALTVVLMLAAALCSIGATGSATFVAPLIFLTAVIPLAVGREWRALAAPVAAGAIPALIGGFALWRFPLAENIGEEPLRAQSWFFHVIFGVGLVGFVAAVALWAAPWIARAGAGERLTTSLVVVATGLLAPGMLALASDISGLSDTLRRELWFLPLPGLVALLAAAPPALWVGRVVPVGPALAVIVAACLVAFGTPVWTGSTGDTQWRHPSWKVPALPKARAILSRYDGTGSILASPGIMKAIAIITVEPKAVNARTLYLERTRESQQRVQERLALTNFITNENPVPTDEEIRRALADLDVGLVCFTSAQKDKAERIEELSSYRPAFETQGYTCLER
jgi:hypothetical protein